MPLNEAQKAFIENNLVRLIDFSLTPETTAILEADINKIKKRNQHRVKEEVNKIKHALLEEVKADHPYYPLRNCFVTPQIDLPLIENLSPELAPSGGDQDSEQLLAEQIEAALNNAPLTVGEVQMGVVEYIDQQITQVAGLSGVALTGLGWNKEEILSETKVAENRGIFQTVLPLPLTAAQKEYLQLVLENCISLPGDRAGLQAEVAKIKQALLAEVPADHAYYQLRQCLVNPWVNLRTIEALQQPITVREVQKGVIECITQVINAAALSAGISLAALGWKLGEMLQLANIKNNVETFRSRPVAEAGTAESDDADVTELARISKDCIYKANFVVRHTFNQVIISIRVAIQYDSLATKLIINNINYETISLPQGREFDSLPYLRINKVEGIIVAEQFTGDYIVRRLIRENHLSPADVGQPANFDAHKPAEWPERFKWPIKLLIHPFYLNALRNKLIFWHQIKNINEQQAKRLLHPNMMRLIALKYCGVNVAKNLPEPEFRIVTDRVFNRLIVLTRCKISMFKGVTDRESNILTFPPITNLIESGVISISDGRSITLAAKQVVSDEFYYQQVRQGKIVIQKIAKIDKSQCDILLDRRIKKLIADNVLDIDVVLRMSLTHIPIVERYQEWVQAGIIEVLNLLKVDRVFYLAIALTNRLFVLYKDGGYLINDRADTIERIKADINAVADTEDLSLEKLRARVIMYLLLSIEEDIEKMGVSDNFPLVFKNIMKEIVRVEKIARELVASENNNVWENALINVLQQADIGTRMLPTYEVDGFSGQVPRANKRVRLTSTLFAPRYDYSAVLENFRQQAQRLIPLQLNWENDHAAVPRRHAGRQ